MNCRGRNQPLLPENFPGIADGCPCNSLRGINHGLVPRETCTCPECDPLQTGSTRKPPEADEPNMLPATMGYLSLLLALLLTGCYSQQPPVVHVHCDEPPQAKAQDRQHEDCPQHGYAVTFTNRAGYRCVAHFRWNRSEDWHRIEIEPGGHWQRLWCGPGHDRSEPTLKFHEHREIEQPIELREVWADCELGAQYSIWDLGGRERFQMTGPN